MGPTQYISKNIGSNGYFTVAWLCFVDLVSSFICYKYFILILFQSFVSENSARQRLVQSLKVVSEAYKEQSKLMLIVAESIGVCSNFDQVVFYASIWTHQPYLDQTCFIAENIVSETF